MENKKRILIADAGETFRRLLSDAISRENDLDTFEAAAVIQIDKSECFRVADRSRPAANRDRSVLKRFGRFVQGHNFCSFHCV